MKQHEAENSRREKGSPPGRRSAEAALLAVSSWSWHAAFYAGSWSLLDLPADAAAAGLTAIEANDFMLPPPRYSRIRRPLLALLPGAPPELWRYSRSTLRQLAANGQAHGTTILAWTINSDFTVPGRQWPAQWLYLQRGLAAARQLRVRLLRVNLGGTPEIPLSRDGRIVRRLVRFVADSQRAVPGLTITLENHWGISTNIDRHLRIFDGVLGRLQPAHWSQFGCCFDPVNMPHGADRARWWRELAARANHYHLKTSAFAAGGRENHLPHPALSDLLAETGYRGPVTIEFAGDGPAAAGIAASANIFRTSYLSKIGPILSA